MSKISLDEGITLCRVLYKALEPKGFYPALTGGLVYKDGLRKDIDIVIYRHRQKIEAFEISELEEVLASAGLYGFKHYGFVTKCHWRYGIIVDLFNPEASDNDETYGVKA